MPVPTPEQKLQWLKPAPITAEETRCVNKLKTGEFEELKPKCTLLLQRGLSAEIV